MDQIIWTCEERADNDWLIKGEFSDGYSGTYNMTFPPNVLEWARANGKDKQLFATEIHTASLAIAIDHPDYDPFADEPLTP